MEANERQTMHVEALRQYLADAVATAEPVAAATVAAAKRMLEPQLVEADWRGSAAAWAALRRGKGPVPAAAAIARAGQSAPLPDGVEHPMLLPVDDDFNMAALQPAALAARLGGLPLWLDGTDNEGVAVTVPCARFVEYMRLQGGSGGGATHGGAATEHCACVGLDGAEAEAAEVAAAAAAEWRGQLLALLQAEVAAAEQGLGGEGDTAVPDEQQCEAAEAAGQAEGALLQQDIFTPCVLDGRVQPSARLSFRCTPLSLWQVFQ